ncbi:PLP-dependent aminotransferase family protein [Mesobacillus harenae]|uniref:MocR-like pyridoxine biosynthesis transcription factor PdxR n=1 Tax=Mesobacillus harenae TaxID=2213203 RepID=UPI001F54CA2F|nr:PLP-dependent aminotransferase family protein [Mesobacillus harenae]
MELTFFIDKTLPEPMYIQLYSSFKRTIETGDIPSGSKLPSIRQLSAQLNISRNTVEAAYQQLLAEGYLISKPKSGLFTADMADMDLLPYQKPVHQEQELSQTGPEIRYDFQYGDISSERFPFQAWKRSINHALLEKGEELLLYGDKQGEARLRCQLADYLYRARGLECNADNVILTTGTQQSISLICQLFSLAGEKIGFENPGYDGVRAVFENHGCKIDPISVKDEGLCVDELEKSNAKIVYVTPSHQFPLGMVMSIQNRLKLLQWASKEEGYVIEDDYDSEFRYSGQPIPSLKGMDRLGRVIYLGTFSKAFLPGIRLSYIVLPKSLLGLYRRKFSAYNQPVSQLIQHAMSQFIESGDFDRHIKRIRKIYQDKHKTLITSISSSFGENAKIIGEKAGLHLLLDIPSQGRESLIDSAVKKSVLVYDPAKYWTDPESCPSNLVLLGFGGLSRSEIEAGVELLKQAWFPGSD